MNGPSRDLASSHGVSRQGALAAVDRAPSWSELFEAANVALSLDRSVWGDEFEQSWVALELWQRCAFVVASSSRIEMGSALDHTSARWMSASVAGVDVERESFAAAKAIASALLTELPAPARDELGILIPGTFHPLAAAAARARSQVAFILADLRAREMADPQHLAGNMPTPKGEAINLLIGTSSWAAMERVGALESLARGKGWNDLWVAGGMGSKGSALSRRVESACAECAWHDALRAGGFAYVASGPTGGAVQSAREASALAQACRSFTGALAHLGLPEVGLGGLGVSINASPVGDYSNAAFERLRFDMVFKAPFAPTSLHHEWIHALDRMTRQAGDTQSLHALDLLEHSVSHLVPDASLLSLHIEESATRLRLAGRQLWRVESRFARKACLLPGATVHSGRELAKACAQLLWEGSSRKDFGSAWRDAVENLSARLLPGQAPIDASFVRTLMLDLRGCRAELEELLRARSEGDSAFRACSRAAAAKNGSSPEIYWLAPDEILARAGQAFFAPLLPADQLDPKGRILLGGIPQTVHPAGSERSDLRAPFEAWVRSMAATACAAVEVRRGKNSLPLRAGSLHEATGLVLDMVKVLQGSNPPERPADSFHQEEQARISSLFSVSETTNPTHLQAVDAYAPLRPDVLSP